MTEPLRRIFTATLIIGSPGVGKTSLLYSFARYLWERYQKILLVYSWDGGAIPTIVQKGIQQGIIRYWRARTRSAEGLGLETLYLATKGYWPQRIDPATGECSPAATLVPPMTVKYDIGCDKGHPLRTVPSVLLVQPIFCPICKEMKNEAQLRVKETITRTKGFELVGGVAFDGLTSMTNVVMDHMDHQRGAGQIGGEKPAFGGIVTSGVIKLGGNNRADVGFGQSRGRQFVDNTLSIPGLVEGPVFTALANETTDEGGLPIVGAKLPGQAATDEASGWFGNVFEMGKFTDDAGKLHYALYLRPFIDAQGRRHLLKTSSSPLGVPSSLPTVLVDPVQGEGEAWSVANLGSVYRMLDEDLARQAAEVLDGAPGPPSGIMEYGESAAVTEPAGLGGPAPAALSPGAPTPSPTAHSSASLPLAVPPALTQPGPSAPTAGSTQAPQVQPRARRRASAPAAEPPAPQPPAAAPIVPPADAPAIAAVAAASLPPAVAPSPVAAPPVATAAPTIAMPPRPGGPPPPPGARPPQRAPGS